LIFQTKDYKNQVEKDKGSGLLYKILLSILVLWSNIWALKIWLGVKYGWALSQYLRAGEMLMIERMLLLMHIATPEIMERLQS
jgi:hypothetical protein